MSCYQEYCAGYPYKAHFGYIGANPIFIFVHA